MTVDRSDIVAARTTGIGIGLIVLMVAWLIGNRIADLFLEPPVGPTVAFVGAVAAGTITSIIAGARLAHRVRRGG